MMRDIFALKLEIDNIYAMHIVKV